MITNVCLLLEAISIVFCTYCLYGEKFKLDITTTCFFSIYMIIMTVINYYKLPQVYTMAIYPVMFLYCGIRFGFYFKAIVINNMLYLIITGGIQIATMMVYYIIFNIQSFGNVDLLIVDCIACIVILLIIPKCKIDRVSIYLQDKERILIIALILCIIVASFCLIQYKKIDKLGLYQYVLLFFSVVFICILVSQLGKYKIRSQKVETELKMHQLYANSFHSLIEDIRLRQHEFDNHINTIYSQHYLYNSYEALINAQKDYCQVVVKENQFNKLLTTGNPVVIGFLYGKFMEGEKQGIEISYNINIDNLDVGVPIYKLVEILGNLIDNAVDALLVSGQKKQLYIAVIESTDEFYIEVRNISKFIEQSDIEAFFKKGFSKKGTSRGLGLYNVKNICNEYSLSLFCENKDYDSENWLSFKINNKKDIVNNYISLKMR